MSSIFDNVQIPGVRSYHKGTPKGYGLDDKKETFENNKILNMKHGFNSYTWWWNVITFLAHVTVSIYIFVIISEPGKNCHGMTNKIQYVEQYIGNILPNQPFPHSWPVRIYNEESVLNSTANGQLGKDHCDNYIATPSKYSACASTWIWDTVETSYDQWNSATLGSSLSIPYLMLIFSWISASYALYYLDTPKSDMKTSPYEEMYQLSSLTVSLPIIWNVAMIVLTLAFNHHDKWAVPVNNIILGIGALSAAIIVQIMYAMPMGADSITRFEFDKESFSIFNSDSDTRKQKEPFLGVHLKDDFIERNHMRTLRYTLSATELRYTEYAITAPILLMAIQSVVVLDGYLWSIQVAYIGMLVTNLLGIPLHQALVYLVRLRDLGISDLKEEGWMVWITYMLLFSSWACFFGSWMPYMSGIGNYWSLYPAGIQYVVVALIIAYIAFGAAATLYYTGWLRNYTKREWTFKWFQRDMISLNLWYDIFSVVIKVTVAFTVFASDRFQARGVC